MLKIKSKLDGKFYITVCSNELTFDIIEEHETLKDYNPINSRWINYSDCEIIGPVNQAKYLR